MDELLRQKFLTQEEYNAVCEKNMLVIKPRYPPEGAGLIDVISKVANSSLAKKVINSGIGKKVIEKATKETFKKVANSSIGKQLQSSLVKDVANASEKAANSAFEKLGLEPVKGVAKVAEETANTVLKEIGVEPSEKKLETVFKKIQKRKAPGGSFSRKKRRKIGEGIVLE